MGMTRPGARWSSLLLLLVLVGGCLVGGAAAAGAATCSNPAWRTSRDDMWKNHGYIVASDMWNTGRYDVRQTVSACSYRNWRVNATADDSRGDGAVKTYPNVHKDFHDWGTGHEPRLRSFRRLTSSFAAQGPHHGIYDVAYDIWLNGVADKDSTEVMIWTDNFHQVPSGSVVAAGRSFSGHTWKVYADRGNHYIAFVPSRPITSGTLGLKRMLGWLVSKGRLGARSTVGQVCFGVEIVSTGGRPATFEVDGFSVSATRT